MLDARDAKLIWESDHLARAERQRRWEYFLGQEHIRELLLRRIDGREKTRNITNWVRYAARLHAGFLASEAPNYTLSDASADKRALMAWQAEYRDRNLLLADRQHALNAILYGHSIEVQTWSEARGTEFWVGDPLQWALVEDSMGDVVAGVARVEVPTGTMTDGALAKEPTVLWYVYDRAGRRVFREGARNEMTEEPALARDGAEGRIEFSVFQACRDRQSFFGPDFLAQSDAYNIARSALSDDIKHNVDSLLWMKGLDLSKMLERDEHGQTVLEKLKKLGVLPLPQDGDAGYLQRVVDVEKFKYDLKLSRQSLHLIACIPDLETAIGGSDSTITNISGVALKLMFHSMIQQASEFAHWLELGLRDRIDLWNARRVRLGLPALEGVEIAMQYHIPFNEMEVLQYLPNLRGAISRRDILRILPFVENVEQAYADLLAEESQGGTEDGPNAGAAANAAADRESIEESVA